MNSQDEERFITWPGKGLISGEEAEAFIEEESKVVATKRASAVDALLSACGYEPPGKGSRPLDRVARALADLGMLDESGGLLNSSEATLRSDGNSDIYFLGLNPGGAAGEDYSIFYDKFPTVYENLALVRLGACGWDQNWSRRDASYEPGQSPLQRRFKHVAAFLRLSYAEIFATNLVFARSRNFKALGNADDQVEACLPIHQMMIEIVQPKRLWVMGNTDSAGSALKLGKDVTWLPAKYANWSIGHGTVEFCGREMILCHTPHLSFWDATQDDKQELLRFAFFGEMPQIGSQGA